MLQKKSRKIICIFEHTRNDLLNIYGKEFEKKITVIYPIISENYLLNFNNNFNNDVIFLVVEKIYCKILKNSPSCKKNKLFKIKKGLVVSHIWGKLYLKLSQK